MKTVASFYLSNRQWFKVGIIVLTLALVSALLGIASIKGAGVDPSSITYLKAQTQDAWTTMALAAADQTGLDVSHLSSVVGTNATDYERTILALTAAGQNPQTYPDENLIAKLKNEFYQAGQIGNPEQVNDDIFGILALASVGEKPTSTIMQDAKVFLLTNQNSDGGWSWAINQASDTNDTAMAISALNEFGFDQNSNTIEAALNYLRSSQNSDGGFPYQPGGLSDSASTAWVISSLLKLGIDPAQWIKEGKNPYTFIEQLLTANGSYKWLASDSEGSSFVTSYVVIALSGKSYPIAKIAAQPLVEFRIEGKENTICEGKLQAQSALDVVVNASKSCGFSYVIEDTSFGPYLKQINNEQAQSLIGWLYLVNYLSPSVGAADYQLNSNDSVIWYYGEFGWPPTRLGLDKTSVKAGETITALAEYFDGSSWLPLSEATVYFNPEFSTDNTGQAVFSYNFPGSYEVRLRKEGFIRSKSVALVIANNRSQPVELSVEVIEAEQGGTVPEIAFNLDKSELDFGILEAGQSQIREIRTSNVGSTDINLTAEVTGDDVFIDNLELNEQNWQDWQTHLKVGLTETIQATLSLPTNATTGSKQGQLIFWAN